MTPDEEDGTCRRADSGRLFDQIPRQVELETPRHCGAEQVGLLVLVVLRCALDRRYPALAPLHPDLGFGLQLEGRLIQTSDPDLDERVAGVGCVEEPSPTAGAEASTVIA